MLNSMIRIEDPRAREIITDAFIKSQMIYHFTPLTAAGLVQDKHLDEVEIQVKRDVFNLPRSCSNKSIRNITTLDKDSPRAII